MGKERVREELILGGGLISVENSQLYSLQCFHSPLT